MNWVGGGGREGGASWIVSTGDQAETIQAEMVRENHPPAFGGSQRESCRWFGDVEARQWPRLFVDSLRAGGDKRERQQ
jgi:hypothetical protein